MIKISINTNEILPVRGDMITVSVASQEGESRAVRLVQYGQQRLAASGYAVAHWQWPPLSVLSLVGWRSCLSSIKLGVLVASVAQHSVQVRH